MSDSFNPPAFPVKDAASYQCHGMTLLDYFAGQALAGLSGHMHHWTNEERSKRAYDTAEAMLAEREKRS